MDMTFETLIARRQGPALELTLNRPESRNAMSLAMVAELQQALAHAGPGFGWRLGSSVKPTTYGVNGILLLACPTLGEALAQVLRFESLVHDLGRSRFQVQGDTVVYSWRNDCAAHPAADALATPQTVSVSPESIALSKDLKKRGWKFVGPTTVYAFMQAMGLINDHAEGCALRSKAEQARQRFKRP